MRGPLLDLPTDGPADRVWASHQREEGSALGRLADECLHDAVAFEDATLFSASVRENVAFGAPDADEDAVEAALTAGNPEGDVLFGVDNTLLSRAVQNKVFVPYTPVAVRDNRISHVDVGLSTFGQGAAVTTSFMGRTVVADDLETG